MPQPVSIRGPAWPRRIEHDGTQPTFFRRDGKLDVSSAAHANDRHGLQPQALLHPRRTGDPHDGLLQGLSALLLVVPQPGEPGPRRAGATDAEPLPGVRRVRAGVPGGRAVAQATGRGDATRRFAGTAVGAPRSARPRRAGSVGPAVTVADAARGDREGPALLRRVGRRRHLLGRRAAAAGRSSCSSAAGGVRRSGTSTARWTPPASPTAAALLRVARQTDLFLYDLKTMDPASTGAPPASRNGRILNNLLRLLRTGREVSDPDPLIPGVNDDDESIDADRPRSSRAARDRAVHLLPFHRSARGQAPEVRPAWLLESERAIPSGPRCRHRADACADHGLTVDDRRLTP